MPNMRKKTKRFIGGYFEHEEVDSFIEIAKRKGVTVKDLLGELIRAEIENNFKGYDDGKNNKI